MRFEGFGAFAAHVLIMRAEMKLAEEVAVVKACELIADAAEEMIGSPHSWWPPLTPETIAHKARGDTPLLESGELRASISWDAPHRDHNVVYGDVGSDDPKAVWHELGTARIPPRPFLSTAAAQHEDAIVDMAGRLIFGALGGPGHHELQALLHILHRAGHELKEFGEEIVKEPENP